MCFKEPTYSELHLAGQLVKFCRWLTVIPRVDVCSIFFLVRRKIPNLAFTHALVKDVGNIAMDSLGAESDNFFPLLPYQQT